MAGVVTIKSIENNSNLGVPVFSRTGRKSNFTYLVFSPQRDSIMEEDLGIVSSARKTKEKWQVRLANMKDNVEGVKKEFVTSSIVPYST